MRSGSASSSGDDTPTQVSRSSSKGHRDGHWESSPVVKAEELHSLSIMSGFDEILRKIGDFAGVLRSKGSLTEIMGIAKPLLYLLAMIRYKSSSYGPVVIGIILHLISLINMKEREGYQNKLEGKYREKELASRRRALFWKYLLNPAVYGLITMPVVKVLLKKMRFGSGTKMLVEGMLTYYRYYHYIL